MLLSVLLCARLFIDGVFEWGVVKRVSLVGELSELFKRLSFLLFRLKNDWYYY